MVVCDIKLTYQYWSRWRVVACGRISRSAAYRMSHVELIADCYLAKLIQLRKMGLVDESRELLNLRSFLDSLLELGWAFVSVFWEGTGILRVCSPPGEEPELAPAITHTVCSSRCKWMSSWEQNDGATHSPAINTMMRRHAAGDCKNEDNHIRVIFLRYIPDQFTKRWDFCICTATVLRGLFIQQFSGVLNLRWRSMYRRSQHRGASVDREGDERFLVMRS